MTVYIQDPKLPKRLAFIEGDDWVDHQLSLAREHEDYPNSFPAYHQAWEQHRLRSEGEGGKIAPFTIDAIKKILPEATGFFFGDNKWHRYQVLEDGEVILKRGSLIPRKSIFVRDAGFRLA